MKNHHEASSRARARVPWNVIREVEDDLARYRGAAAAAAEYRTQD